MRANWALRERIAELSPDHPAKAVHLAMTRRIPDLSEHVAPASTPVPGGLPTPSAGGARRAVEAIAEGDAPAARPRLALAAALLTMRCPRRLAATRERPAQHRDEPAPAFPPALHPGPPPG
ncbi:hypothetical protein [Nonomuraea sp. SYSU D8015]|uniref:hypothetical protein n=1 Tax=Nonomuraea sp. SYSU D8015 TaxID=2593644 RepID=UPI00166014DA|nr:hypothetical protein [Nonomuraea sp. SYSU D8015]